MPALVGVGGARRNACAAVLVNGRISAACEQERLTRVRGIGFGQHGFPAEAVDEVLALAGCSAEDVSRYVLAEDVSVPPSPSTAVEHHQAHAAAAFLTSPFQQAAVIVCDRHPAREVSVWLGDGSQLTDRRWPWSGSGFATLYSECAALFGLPAPGRERQLEALAHLSTGEAVEALRATLRYVDGSLVCAASWRAQVAGMIDRDRGAHGHAAATAAALQRRIGELLLEFLADVRAELGVDAVCLGGGLFYNTYFTTLVRRSGLFRDVFVPINPGNAGLAVGATLMLAAEEGGPASRAVSPFLGPEFDSQAIKAILDGCKLSYAFVSESGAVDAAVEALARGQLVGWFQGRMEWGPRALGHRSILADPRSPYVLDNLNCFLRKRERWRSFGVSVREESVSAVFTGPATSSCMEYQYGLRDDRLRHVMPAGATSIRVQTVPADAGLFRTLHQRMEQATGSGILVNTSLNGFHEPIACTPRDAVRVFYGTGLDVLILGRFILRK